MTSDQDQNIGDDDFDLETLRAQARAETQPPDPATRAAHLRLASENFAKLHATRQEPQTGARHTLASPGGGLWQGVKDMLNALTTRGGLTATTALVACGILILTPAGQDLWRGTTLTEADVTLPEVAPPPPPEQLAAPEPVAGPLARQAAPQEAARDLSGPQADAAATALPEAAAETAADMEIAPTMNAVPAMPQSLPAPGPAAEGFAVGAVAGLRAEAPMIAAPDTEAFANTDDNPLRITAQDPVSTFSIDVDTASYAVVRRSLNAGQLPPRDAVRVEEMVNYFPYAYAAPEPGTVPFRPTVTVMGTPWNADTQLVHIGIQGALPAIADRPALNLVFLIDTSGSMEAPDKLPLLKQSFRLLIDQLRPQDQVAIVEYAGSAGLVLPPTAATERTAILRAIGGLGAGGGDQRAGRAGTGL